MEDVKENLGIATMPSAMKFAGIKSRTTILEWERKGEFPRRVQMGGARVGYLWSDLHMWRDGLEKAEIQGIEKLNGRDAIELSSLVVDFLIPWVQKNIDDPHFASEMIRQISNFKNEIKDKSVFEERKI